MTDTIEPTEEQKQAALRMWKQSGGTVSSIIDDIARLLAEREHKLREDIKEMVRIVGPQHKELIEQEEELERRGEKILELRADLDAARARIAELEETTIGRLVVEAEANRASHKSDRMEMQQHIAKITDQKAAAFRRLADMEKREAAHLAHIKALRERVKSNQESMRFMAQFGFDLSAAKVLNEDVLADTAHYDVEGEETK
jgi:chromosome segregation ATPase